MIKLNPLPPTFVETREGLHTIAEHVLAPLQYEENQLIGLRPTPFGFGTQMLGLDRQVRVSDGLLYDSHRDEDVPDDIVTIAEASAFVQLPPGAVQHAYTPVTDGDPHRRLTIDVKAANVLGEWFTFGATVITQVRNVAAPEETPSIMQLWPEHFDLATDLGVDGKRVNVGASPGDAEHPEPYVYVGPRQDKPDDPIWNEPFGASLSYAELLASADAVADAVAWIAKVRAVLG